MFDEWKYETIQSFGSSCNPIHFVILRFDHRISNFRIRAKWEHTFDNSPTEHISYSLKWWSSKHGLVESFCLTTQFRSTLLVMILHVVGSGRAHFHPKTVSSNFDTLIQKHFHHKVLFIQKIQKWQIQYSPCLCESVAGRRRLHANTAYVRLSGFNKLFTWSIAGRVGFSGFLGFRVFRF